MFTFAINFLSKYLVSSEIAIHLEMTLSDMKF